MHWQKDNLKLSLQTSSSKNQINKSLANWCNKLRVSVKIFETVTRLMQNIEAGAAINHEYSGGGGIFFAANPRSRLAQDL